MKTVIIILIAILFSIEIYSKPILTPREIPKFSLGIEAGTNYNVLSTTELPFEFNNNFGYNLGVNYVYFIGDTDDAGLLFNVNYLNRKHSYTNVIDNASGDISFNTLQFKFNYMYKIYGKFHDYSFYAIGGPVFGYLFDNKASNESGILLENDQSFEFLFNLGLRYEKFLNKSSIGLEYNYQIGLTNMNTNFNRFGNNTHNLMFTYRIYFYGYEEYKKK